MSDEFHTNSRTQEESQPIQKVYLPAATVLSSRADFSRGIRWHASMRVSLSSSLVHPLLY